MSIKPHRKQFLIAPRPIELGDDWSCMSFGDKYLCHQEDLNVSKAVDADGRPWILLGRAIEVEADRSGAREALQSARTSDVPRLSQSWAGRWLLIEPDHIFTDACGLLGCLYTTDPEGALWVSSSPMLLAEHAFDGTPKILDDRRLKHELGISWFPPPRTRYDAIRRLLPSQTLSLKSSDVAPRPLLPDIGETKNYGQALDWLTSCLQTVMARLRQEVAGPLWLGLTAGYDSRLMLAIAAKSGIDIQPYTRLTPRMLVADRMLPPELCKLAGYRHHTMIDQRTAVDRLDQLKRHAGDNVALHDATPFLSGVRSAMSGLTFGGHGFALAGGFGNWRQLPSQLPGPGDATRLFLQQCQEPLDSPAAFGLRQWFEWIEEHPQPHLDWRDRLFLEQRQTGWLAAKEQIYDMETLERFPILNCAQIYACLLAIDTDKRVGSLIQEDMIRLLSPDLAALPFNPPDRSYLTRAPHRVFQRRWFFLSRRAARRLEQTPATHRAQLQQTKDMKDA